MECWLAQLAMVQARFTARCIYNRASACKDALNPPFRPASMVDVDLTLSCAPPPRATPYITAAARAAAAAAAALAVPTTRAHTHHHTRQVIKYNKPVRRPMYLCV